MPSDLRVYVRCGEQSETEAIVVLVGSNPVSPTSITAPMYAGCATEGRHRVVGALTILISFAATSTSKPARIQPRTFSTGPVLSLVNVSTAPLARNRQTANSRATRSSFGMEPTVCLSAHTTAGPIDWRRLFVFALHPATCAGVPHLIAAQLSRRSGRPREQLGAPAAAMPGRWAASHEPLHNLQQRCSHLWRPRRHHGRIRRSRCRELRPLPG
jgi:hypothetical protein